MTDIRRIKPIIIKVANGENMTAKKRGILHVKNEETNVTINMDALIVLAQKINAGFKVIFNKGYAKIVNERAWILCKSMGNLFAVQFQIETPEMCKIT